MISGFLVVFGDDATFFCFFFPLAIVPSLSYDSVSAPGGWIYTGSVSSMSSSKIDGLDRLHNCPELTCINFDHFVHIIIEIHFYEHNIKNANIMNAENTRITITTLYFTWVHACVKKECRVKSHVKLLVSTCFSQSKVWSEKVIFKLILVWTFHFARSYIGTLNDDFI